MSTKETEEPNLPASTYQYPNWQRKMRYTIEEMQTNADGAGLARMFQHWLMKIGRATRQYHL